MVGQTSDEDREELSKGEQPIVHSVNKNEPPPLVVTTNEDGVEEHAAPSGWRFEDTDSDSDNWNIVPDIKLDPETTDIPPSLQGGSTDTEGSGVEHVELKESKHTTREIVKEEINKYFSNRRKS